MGSILIKKIKKNMGDTFNLFSFVRMMLLSKPKTPEFDVRVLTFLIEQGINIYSRYYKYYKFIERQTFGNVYSRHEQDIIRNMIDYIIDAHIDHKNNYNGYLDVLKMIFERQFEMKRNNELIKIIDSIDIETIKNIVNHKAFDIIKIFIHYTDSTKFMKSKFHKRIIYVNKTATSTIQGLTEKKKKIINDTKMTEKKKETENDTKMTEKKTETENDTNMIEYEKSLEMTISNALMTSSNDNNKILENFLPSINMKQKYPPNQLTPLFYLIKNENIDGIDILSIRNDFDINELDDHGDTPLLYTIKNSMKNESLIKYLLSHKADIN